MFFHFSNYELSFLSEGALGWQFLLQRGTMASIGGVCGQRNSGEGAIKWGYSIVLSRGGDFLLEPTEKSDFIRRKNQKETDGNGRHHFACFGGSGYSSIVRL
jgi:hypothetical protein